ncbi:FecCD family ABC transporter permease [Xenorhabdus doucetiae]|uniref:Achromobactin transport system permease protein CbrB n=1 Tax=Xenorhabdus doucetiae TaxID=351671 RepID=A0A068QSA4_9GAMM|nr:iron ABC transporter permease [Xenorhabdus doucetiae]TYP11601.1 iron complex transport system permease protein [Xenorhabdus doucetiae]CDG17669.1 Achromobactin transport system permease protein CbrB [Xenorhabdus doucetiae]
MNPVLKISLLVTALLASVLLSLMAGAQWIPFPQVLAALFMPDDMNLNHILVHSTRLSRTLLAVMVGAALTVSGTLMQALTRNPLASPGLFGVNAGAVFGIILGSSLFSLTSLNSWLWSALPGAALAGALVWLVGNMGQGKMNPLRIVLAGASITAMFTAFSQAWLVVDQEGLDTVLFWLAGSLNERSLQAAAPLMLSCLPALLVALGLGRQINVLNTGEELATGLGQNIAIIRLVVSVLIVWLAGCAVALAGSIGFIGLVVPHMARRLISIDHRWLLPGGALLGALLLVLADILARVVILPQEVPVGVMTALFGAPFFIALARKGGRYA